MKRARLVAASQIVVAAALTVVAVWQLSSHDVLSGTETSRETQVSAPVPEAPAAVFEMATLDAYGEIKDRPLFSHTRRPPVPEVAKAVVPKPPAPKPVPPPDWNLVGTAIIGEAQAALVWDARNNRFVRLAPGMTEGRWEITSVQPEYIVLSHGDLRREIKLPRF